MIQLPSRCLLTLDRRALDGLTGGPATRFSVFVTADVILYKTINGDLGQQSISIARPPISCAGSVQTQAGCRRISSTSRIASNGDLGSVHRQCAGGDIDTASRHRLVFCAVIMAILQTPAPQSASGRAGSAT